MWNLSPNNIRRMATVMGRNTRKVNTGIHAVLYRVKPSIIFFGIIIMAIFVVILYFCFCNYDCYHLVTCVMIIRIIIIIISVAVIIVVIIWLNVCNTGGCYCEFSDRSVAPVTVLQVTSIARNVSGLPLVLRRALEYATPKLRFFFLCWFWNSAVLIIFLFLFMWRV